MKKISIGLTRNGVQEAHLDMPFQDETDLKTAKAFIHTALTSKTPYEYIVLSSADCVVSCKGDLKYFIVFADALERMHEA
jgi:hypothetical protein